MRVILTIGIPYAHLAPGIKGGQPIRLKIASWGYIIPDISQQGLETMKQFLLLMRLMTKTPGFFTAADSFKMRHLFGVHC